MIEAHGKVRAAVIGNRMERKTLYQLDEKWKSIMDMLESKGEGEITIGQMAFPDIRL
ncbi:hypothetical protein [Peribacillus simplex]|uniref:hypothetical protein n=1 Tax=Peribacillus simplex TaxID=1478 RepID=UPI00366EFBDC